MPQGGVTNQASDDLFAKPPMVSWGLSQRTETTDQDVYGNIICNSAGDVFSNLPNRTLFSLTLRITRWERKFDVFKTRYFVNKLNLREVIAGDVKFPAMSMLCTFIAPVEEFAAGANAVRIGYDFEIRPTVGSSVSKDVSERPFAYWTIDTGVRSFGTGKTDPLDLYYSTNKTKQVSSDVRLNGQGKPVNASDYVVQTSETTMATPTVNPKPVKRKIPPVKFNDAYLLGFDVYETADFLQLGL